MPDAIDADLEGPVSPPRDNGEIVFAAPWERRAFGLTVALCRRAAVRLGGLPPAADRPHRRGRPPQLLGGWAAALEDVLETTRDALDPAELDALARAYQERPAGHDHH